LFFPVSCSAGHGFRSLVPETGYITEVFRALYRPVRKISGWCIERDRDWFLPYLFFSFSVTSLPLDTVDLLKASLKKLKMYKFIYSCHRIEARPNFCAETFSSSCMGSPIEILIRNLWFLVLGSVFLTSCVVTSTMFRSAMVAVYRLYPSDSPGYGPPCTRVMPQMGMPEF
jgi:hypothetical protein